MESLLTNISLQETIDLRAENLFNDKEYFHDISKDSFRELLNLNINEYFILFSNGCCLQLDGLAMSTPLGPTFASTFFSLNKVIWQNNFSLEFKLKIYKHMLMILSYFLKMHNKLKILRNVLIVNNFAIGKKLHFACA